MRTSTDLFKINGSAMFAPDADMEMSFEDIDAADSGRDESGVMHRIMVRYKVGTWSFVYSAITPTEYAQLEALFTAAGQEFTFTHPSKTGLNTPETSTCYRSKYSISWTSSRTGMVRNYKFNIIEC